LNIKGQIEDIIYHNEENGYTVCNINVNNDIIVAVGTLPFISSGDIIEAEGNMVNHAIYGEQFKISSFEKSLPSSIEEIEKYLGSGIIKGIGPATSKKIVDRFGEDTIYVLRFEPYKLAMISGISSSKAQIISDEFNKEWQLWQIVIFLQKYNIGTNNANRVYKELGANAIDKIKENPYSLLDILYGVDFETIDKMAIELGVNYNSTFRISSGIKYALANSSKNGNTCAKINNLITYVANILKVAEEQVDEELKLLADKNEIYIENDKVSLSFYYEAEEQIAKRAIMMNNEQVKKCINIDKKIIDIEREIKIDLSEEQIKAIKMVFNNKISIITGGPGTGKTTIIKTIIKLMQIEKLSISLCAPTGRAAKRITETTGEDAKTLHRLLALAKTEDDNISLNFEVSKIESDVVIVDEMSMVDTILMHFLMRALKSKTRLVLIGDADQLPSVGPGNVLKDMIASDIIPYVRLTQIYRQASQSDIIVNAHKINQGEKIDLSVKDNDFFFINSNDIFGQVSSLVSKRLKSYGNYDSFRDIQVLTPTKKGESGTKILNKQLQDSLNPANNLKKEKDFGGVTFREGDKVMQIKNDYDLYWETKDGKNYGTGVYNGDIGVINKIVDNEVEVLFDDDKLVMYDNNNLEELEHAYAITVHKSQGSEFPVVIMPIISGPPMLYTRNLLYTGVTRAKKLLIVVGNSNMVYSMINNNNSKTRNTGLKDKLEKYMQLFSKV